MVLLPSCVVLLQLHRHDTDRWRPHAHEHERTEFDSQPLGGATSQQQGGGLTLCLSMISLAMHAGGPLSLKGVPIQSTLRLRNRSTTREGAGGTRTETEVAGGWDMTLTGGDDRKAGFVCIEELISTRYRCPDRRETEAGEKEGREE